MSRSHLTNWPETKLGPIDAINPKYPLPGYVGLVEKKKRCEVALISAASNLPIPSTHHYASVLSQAEYSIEESVETQSLVPKLDPTLEHIVHSCPEIIKSDLSTLYPTKDFSGSRLTSISFHYSLKNPKDAENFENVYELFVQSALDVCASLNQMGYWADFIHPKTGIPYIGFHLHPNSDARLTNFGFYVNANGCCKVNRERLLNQRLFVGIIFTDAPKDHPVIKHMQNTLAAGHELVWFVQAFAICHAFYTIAYGFKPPRFSLIFPFIIAFLTMNYHFAPALRGPFIYAIPVYSFILSVMIWRAVSLALETSSYSLALGSILFGISDALLGINMFLRPLEHSSYSIMATYYLGQLGIAISALSTESKQKIN
nr:methylmalonic aciduria (cobalamin deficiency) [Hymenolepis microstoma]